MVELLPSLADRATSSTHSTSDNRCKPNRMGSTLWAAPNTCLMVHSGTDSPHQPSGDHGGPESIQSFSPTDTRLGVQVITDNTTTMHYISKQGGTCSASLLFPTPYLSSGNTRRHDNVLVNKLSRMTGQSHEWELNDKSFHLTVSPHPQWTCLPLIATKNAVCMLRELGMARTPSGMHS